MMKWVSHIALVCKVPLVYTMVQYITLHVLRQGSLYKKKICCMPFCNNNVFLASSFYLYYHAKKCLHKEQNHFSWSKGDKDFSFVGDRKQFFTFKVFAESVCAWEIANRIANISSDNVQTSIPFVVLLTLDCFRHVLVLI